jgi:hypothetical protein
VIESPAMLHKARVLSEQAAHAALHGDTAAMPAGQAASGNHRLSFMVAAIETARHELKNLNSLAERCKAKRERYLPQFAAFVDDYLKAGEVYANPVLVWVTLWSFDVRDIERALFLADICIEQQQPMPEGWARDMQTVVADEVLDWARECQNAKTSSAPYFEQVLARVLSAGATGQWCVFEKIQTAYAKHAGDLAYAQNNSQAALDFYRSAQRIAGGPVGLKTRVAELEKIMAKTTDSTRSSAAMEAT